MMSFAAWVKTVDEFVWGPVMLVLLMGTGVFLTIRTRFLAWRNLGYGIKSVISRASRTQSRGPGDVSPYSALMTALAATIGTGNIVGVATALVSGGPGALVWMELSAIFGITSKFSECMLAVKYRQRNADGEMSGGPMYTMRNALKCKPLGMALAFFFAVSTVLASFGIGNMTQAHSIAQALQETFAVPNWLSGACITMLSLLIILGGIQSISKVTSLVVPFMAAFYMLAGAIVLYVNRSALPQALILMFQLAFSPSAAAGGVAGTMTASVLNAAQSGIARGCFSNEAGMGSAAIPAAAAASDHPVRQGYINMTGTFFDTIVICTMTGLVICSSGVLGTLGPDGIPINGSALTSLAFGTVLGKPAGIFIALSITLFAFSTILGWEYYGEKAFEYLFGVKPVLLYRMVFSLVAFVGATESLEVVWNLSDIFNAMMALPNLICLLLLTDTIVQEMELYQPQVAIQKAARQAQKAARRRR